MYNNDESGRQGQSQGQGTFVRRTIPKYNGDGKSGYQPQSQSGGYSGGSSGYGSGSSGYSGSNSGYSARQSGDGQSSYQNRNRRPDGSYGGGGGYKSGGSSGYGYNNRNTGYGGANDRLIRQNDIMIKLLKEIRDRLPAPAGMTNSSYDNYESDRSYDSGSSGSYGTGSSDSYSESVFEPSDSGSANISTGDGGNADTDDDGGGYNT